MARWKPDEVKQLHSLAKRRVAFDAICLRLEKSAAAVRSKARREGLKINLAVPLPKVDQTGKLLRLGGVNIPSHPQWIKPHKHSRR